MTYVTTIWEVTDLIVDKLTTNAGALGINYVGAYDEKRIPRYPAVVVSPGSRVKELGGSQTFDVSFLVDLWVYHAVMTETHAVRSKKDLQLVADIESVLEADYTLVRTTPDGPEDSVIFGFIANETPGVLQPAADKSDIIVGTRMQWMGTSRRRF